MAKSAEVRAGEKRVGRFVGDADRAAQLKTVSAVKQLEILNLAYQGDTAGARAMLKRSAAEIHAVRSQASRKAAATTLDRRRTTAVQKMLYLLGRMAHQPTVRKESKAWGIYQIRNIEQRQGNDLIAWIQGEARRPVPKGEHNPMWYR